MPTSPARTSKWQATIAVCWRASPSGLTLIELLVVLAILSLVTATVVTRVGGTLGPAALAQAVSQFEFTDQQMRLRAERAGQSVAMHVKLGTNCLECFADGESEDNATTRALARGVRLTNLMTATREVTNGTAIIRYTDRGTTETFAIELAGRSDARRWLLVTGLTGQVTELPNEQAAREIFDAISSPGIHAR